MAALRASLQTVRRGTQTVHFQYAGGQRIRKLVKKGGGIVEERLYFGNDEVFERRKGIGFEKIVEQTFTEHIGGSLRVETKTIKAGKAIAKPKSLWRYQITDHLGSSALEVNEHGKVIAYEEFHPYGTTAYRATNKEVEIAANRYRFTGMERDDETGLALHGARYYAPWLGRWTSADPIGLSGGINRYRYCDGDPVGLADPNGMAPGDLVSERATIPYESPPGQPRDQHIRFADSEVGEPITQFGRDADGDPIVSLATGLADHPDDSFAKAQAEGARSRRAMATGFLGRKVFGVGTLSKVLGVSLAIGALSAAASAAVAIEIGAAASETILGTGVIAAGGGVAGGIAYGVLDSATRQYVETGSVGDVGDLAVSGIKSGAVGAYSAFGLAVLGRGLAPLGPDKRVSLVPERTTAGGGRLSKVPESAGGTNTWTSAEALEQVTGRTALARQKAIGAVPKEDLANVNLSYTPRYSQFARTGVASPPGHPSGAGIQIGKNAFSSRHDLMNTIVHEELHHRWWRRGIPSFHRNRGVYSPTMQWLICLFLTFGAPTFGIARASKLRLKDAQKYEERGFFVVALKSAEEAIELDPNDAEAHYVLGRIHGKTGRHLDAAAAFKAGQAVVDHDDPLRAELAYARGTALVAQTTAPALPRKQREGLLREAIVEFDTAIAATPRHREAHYRRAQTSDILDDPDAADADLRQCIRIDPQYAPCFAALAWLYVEYGFVREALAVLDAGLEATPGSAVMLVGAGRAYLALGRAEDAIAAFERAKAIDPQMLDVLFGLGIAHADLRQRQPAVENLQSFLWLTRDNVPDMRKAEAEAALARMHDVD